METQGNRTGQRGNSVTAKIPTASSPRGGNNTSKARKSINPLAQQLKTQPNDKRPARKEKGWQHHEVEKRPAGDQYLPLLLDAAAAASVLPPRPLSSSQSLTDFVLVLASNGRRFLVETFLTSNLLRLASSSRFALRGPARRIFKASCGWVFLRGRET